MSKSTFTIIHKTKESSARVGEFQCGHGLVKTPAFVPVGTQATVKSLTPKDLNDIGVQILFGNTYHLHLRPGEEVISDMGGLGKFMSWNGVTMTDSGGFQVFSLGKAENNEGEANLVKVTEDEVRFRSHLDGSLHTFTPEKSISIQKKIGADIVLAFDQCSSYPISQNSAKEDMERTHRWALRSLEEFKKENIFTQSIFGIVHGSVFENLRKESARFIASQDFDGIAIGGVAVGESRREMIEAVEWVIPHLPEGKIRHLLGVGDIESIFQCVERGIDTFDCVIPSRLGRIGHVFVYPREGTIANRFQIDITKSYYSRESQPLSTSCSCYVCRNFTRGYVNHLFRARELLAYRLATYHNIFFIVDLMKRIRESLLENEFELLKKQWLQ